VKSLLAQLRLVFEAPAPAPLAPEPVQVRSAGPGPRLEREAPSGIPAPLAPRLIRHPRARQYVLRVLPDGTPRVTIPRWGSKRDALAFLEAQRDWVARQRAKQAERQHAAPSRVWRDGDQVLLGGRLLRLARGSGRPGVVEHDGRLVVTPRPRDGDDLRPSVTAWMLIRARHLLPPRLLTLAAQFDLDVTTVSVRNQRARWGSCATGGRISLNWRLIQTPDEVRDYVLIHELMHLRQPNHSARFWALVARACPGHEASRRWLRAHEAALLDAR
jgi:predicted metal-dependent hydrolase